MRQSSVVNTKLIQITSSCSSSSSSSRRSKHLSRLTYISDAASPTRQMIGIESCGTEGAVSLTVVGWVGFIQQLRLTTELNALKGTAITMVITSTRRYCDPSCLFVCLFVRSCVSSYLATVCNGGLAAGGTAVGGLLAEVAPYKRFF